MKDQKGQEAFHPLVTAVALHGGFVARSFSGMHDHMVEMIRRGIAHQGFSLIDILQPCVSFNKVNTFAWYKKRCYNLPKEYDPTEWEAAMKTAMEWGEKIPVGVIYENDRPDYADCLPVLQDGPLVGRKSEPAILGTILSRYL